MASTLSAAEMERAGGWYVSGLGTEEGGIGKPR